MLREIRFRGKRMDCGAWEIGDYSHYTGENGTTHHYINGFEYEVDPATVGQFTGPKDHNGKEVYEGDILSFCVFNHNGKDTHYIGVVKWANTGFEIWHDPESEYYGADGGFDLAWVRSQDDELEVIGNVYDHPHLRRRRAMDKRIGYICPGGAYGENLCHCVATDQACPDQASCEYVAFVSPSDLAALETQVAEVKAACGLRDGALRDLVGRIDHTIGANTDWLDPELPKAREALSQTPESVKREAEDARVGRLLQTLVDEARKRTESCGISWGHVPLAELEHVIAQAREGEKP